MSPRFGLRSIFVLFAFVAVLGGMSAHAQTTAGTGAAERASPTPAVVPFEHPVVFTMALGNPATNGAIATILARRLHENGRNAAASGPVRSDAWVVPMGQWTLGDYLEQCKRDPRHTLGAVIALPPVNFTTTDNYITILRTNVESGVSLIVAACHEVTAAPATPPPTLASSAPALAPQAAPPSPADAPPAVTERRAPPVGEVSVLWASYAERGRYGRSQIEFFPLAVLTSVYLAFAPQRTYQTTTTTVYPTTNPLPPGGTRSQVQVQQASVLNPSGTSGLQGNVLSAFAGNGLGATIGGAASADSMAVRAADDAIGHILQEQLPAVCASAAKVSTTVSGVTPPAVPAPSIAPRVLLTARAGARAHEPLDFCSW